jgi:hypothetical protein
MIDMVDCHDNALTQLCCSFRSAAKGTLSSPERHFLNSWGCRHRPKVMFGVLVVILCPDRIADESFSTSERQIPLVASLRVLRVFRLGAYGIRFPRLGADSK